MIKCPNCGKRNPEGNKFCGECGTDLSEAEMQCPNCEKMHKDGEKFCTDCGTKLITPTQYIIMEQEERDLFLKKMSESLDDISVKVLADEMIPNWIYESKEEILDDILVNYDEDYDKITKVMNNLPSEKYEVFKLFFELDEASLQELTYFMPPNLQKRKMDKEQILEYMLKNNDVKLFKQKIIASIVPPKLGDNEANNPLTSVENKNIKYEMVNELFEKHPIKTDILLKEVCRYLNFAYTSSNESYLDLCENYSVPRLIKTIRQVEEKNAENNMEQVRELFIESSIQNEPLVRRVCKYLKIPYKSYYGALSIMCSYDQDEVKEAISIVEKEFIEKYGNTYKKAPSSSKKKSNNKKGFLGGLFS